MSDDYLEPTDEDIDDDRPGISEILEAGYEMLDRFVHWLEADVRLDTRAAQQDCFNAECLLDYMANQHRSAIANLNEFQLRWFYFSYYIRKANGDDETETRLPESLVRLFEFLRAEEGYQAPGWLASVLNEASRYFDRRREYRDLDPENESVWLAGFRDWCAELEDHLDARSLWLPRDCGDGLYWGDRMGWREAGLHEEATRLWQEERELMLAEGLDLEAIRDRLAGSFQIWMDTPMTRLDGSTPRDIILLERSEAVADAEEAGDEQDEIELD